MHSSPGRPFTGNQIGLSRVTPSIRSERFAFYAHARAPRSGIRVSFHRPSCPSLFPSLPLSLPLPLPLSLSVFLSPSLWIESRNARKFHEAARAATRVKCFIFTLDRGPLLTRRVEGRIASRDKGRPLFQANSILLPVCERNNRNKK